MAPRKQAKNPGSGSPTTGEPEYLVVGSLRRAHGVRGEMVMEVVTDFPERLKPGTKLYVGPQHEAMILEGARPHGEGMLVKFRGIETPEDAGRHRNQLVHVTAADRPALPKGQFYEHQILGFRVLDDGSGETIGTLSEVLHTGANDIYVVAREGGGEVLIPVIASVVLALDAEKHEVRVRLLPGLLGDAEGA